MIPKSQKILTQARVKELLHYDPETGIFTRRVRVCNQAAGKVAGCIHNQGYWQIVVDRKVYLAHRLAVLYMTGAWPEADVDHMNGDRSDGRWENLRCVPHQSNQHNIGGVPAHNTSGLLGASWDKRKGCWRAFITLNSKYVHLGYHPTAEAAHAAYLKAKNELHPSHLRLRVGQ
jgi:hypothetical protein